MLSKDWITTPAIDLELKQYLLLAYLQKVERRFGEMKLYPHLHELRAHVQAINDWEKRKEEFLSAMPGRLIGLDLSELRLKYEKHTPTRPEVLCIIEEVMGLAEPRLQRSLAAGQNIREEVLSHIEMHPIGLIPLRKDEGYILLHHPVETRVYGFSVGPVKWAADPERIHIRTHYVTSYSANLSTYPERIRLELIENNRDLPEPLTMMVGSDVEIPCVETFLPIARQMVYQYVVKG